MCIKAGNFDPSDDELVWFLKMTGDFAAHSWVAKVVGDTVHFCRRDSEARSNGTTFLIAKETHCLREPPIDTVPQNIVIMLPLLKYW